MNDRSTLAVAIHDGYYGCGTGAGYANHGFLETLVSVIPDDVRLAVLPVFLHPAGTEYHAHWHARARTLLDRPRTSVHPVSNGTAGTDRWGTLENFRTLVRDTARRLAVEVLPGAGPALVVAFDAPFLGLAALLPPARRRDVVLIPRSSALIHAPWDAPRVAWERAGLHAGLADGTRVGVISPFLGRHLRENYGVPARSMVAVRDGLAASDWERFSGTAATAGHPGDFVLAMGRAEPYKGFEDLIDAYALARRAGHDLPHLLLAATAEADEPTPYQRTLAARLQALGVDASMRYRFTPEVAGLLRHPGLRAVVVPSRAEPFGRIPMEAFAAGAVPVITTTAQGLAGQVVDGETGFTCPAGSPPALAAALGKALELDPGQRRAMWRRARQQALRDHDHAAAVRTFLRHTAPWLRLPRADDRLRWLSTTAPPAETRNPVSAPPPVKVPIGLQAPHWTTVEPDRYVLVVAHHVTSLLRLLDVITVFDADPRVQVVFTWNGSDPFRHGLDRLLDELGVVLIPWSQAIDTEFDLAIAANHGGLTEITAPLVIIPHGVGYTKNSPGNRKPETGNRKPETGNRKPETVPCSGFPRNGCSTTASRSRRRWSSPTRTNASAWRRRPRRPPAPPWSRAIPPTTAWCAAVTCGPATVKPSASGPARS
ncbi:glycosyltransferase family 4 protein [Amycolatopsis sp. MtRt-6]|uniref:glycosyltransferase family 4 protein n=1 Tax=Amycolatopsis sp. MtRt-6 TaxID=2792782 RepID=UPI001A8CA48B|nr:glycosyltransferase family 4 protein [Amycolatopsis sp. MtRt-6]